MEQLNVFLGIAASIVAIVGAVGGWIAVTGKSLVIEAMDLDDHVSCRIYNRTGQPIEFEVVEFALDGDPHYGLWTRIEGVEGVNSPEGKTLQPGKFIDCVADLEANKAQLADNDPERPLSDYKTGRFYVCYSTRTKPVTSKRIPAPDMSNWETAATRVSRRRVAKSKR